MLQYRAVCTTGDLPLGTMRRLQVEGLDIVVCNVDGALHAMDNTCMHAGGPLHEGELEGSIITCPWHHWQFDCTDGACSVNPTQTQKLYPVRVHDGQVEVQC